MSPVSLFVSCSSNDLMFSFPLLSHDPSAKNPTRSLITATHRSASVHFWPKFLQRKVTNLVCKSREVDVHHVSNRSGESSHPPDWVKEWPGWAILWWMGASRQGFQVISLCKTGVDIPRHPIRFINRSFYDRNSAPYHPRAISPSIFQTQSRLSLIVIFNLLIQCVILAPVKSFPISSGR